MIVCWTLLHLILHPTLTHQASPETSAEPALFQSIGEVATDTAAFLIIGRIDLYPIEEQLAHIRDTIQYLRDTKSPDDQIAAKQLQVMEFDTLECLRRIEEMRLLTRTPSRPKRSAVLIAAGLTALGGALGALFSNHQLSKRIDELERQRDNTLHYVDAAVRQINSNNQKLAHLNATLTQLVKHDIWFHQQVDEQQQELRSVLQKEALISLAQYAVTQATHNIYSVLDTWTQALHGQVTVDLFHPDMVQDALKRIANQANGPLRLAFEPTDLETFYKLPCHTDVNNGTMRVVVPVPVYNIKETFTIHRHLPLPIMTNQGHELRVTHSNQYLMMNEEGTLYQELNQPDLNACVKLRQLHLCPHLRVLTKTSTITCLYALYQGDIEQMQRRCPFEFQPESQGMELHQVGVRTFLLFTKRLEEARITCKNGSRDTEYKTGVTTLQLPDGCTFNSKEYYIATARNGWLSPEMIVTKPPRIPPFDLSQLLNHNQPHRPLPSEDIDQLLSRLEQHDMSQPIPISELATVTRQEDRTNSWSTSALLTALTALVSIYCGLVWYQNCRPRSQRCPWKPTSCWNNNSTHATPGQDTATRTQRLRSEGGNCSETPFREVIIE